MLLSQLVVLLKVEAFCDKLADSDEKLLVLVERFLNSYSGKIIRC